MRARRVLILALATVLTATTLATSGCSISETKGKAALSAALLKFDATGAIFALTIQGMDNDATVTSDGESVAAALRAGKDKIADDWQSVIKAAAKVDGADVTALEKAWSNLEDAIESVPEGATAAEAGAIIGAPTDDLMRLRGELWDLVKGSK